MTIKIENMNRNLTDKKDMAGMADMTDLADQEIMKMMNSFRIHEE